MTSRRQSVRILWSFLGLAVAVLLVYFKAPLGERLFDDIPLLRMHCNDSLAAFSLDGACSYRPVRHLSFALVGTLFGAENNFAQHVVNIVLHLTAALGVWAIVRRLLGAEAAVVSFLAALLFAVHPAQVDAVAYISGRRDVLCGMLFIIAFLLFLQSHRGSSRVRKATLLAAAALLWGAALGSKEMAVTLPAIALWYEFTVRAPDQLESPTLWKRARVVLSRYFKWFAPALVAAAGFVAYRGFIDSKSFLVREGAWWGGSWWTNTMTGVALQRYYAELVLVPFRLPGDWNPPMVNPVESMSELRFWMGLGILLALLASIVVALRRQRNLVAFGLGWYLIALSPVLQVIPHHEIFAEHYLYIPLVGLLIAGAAGLSGFLETISGQTSRRVVVGIVTVVALLFGLRARSHVADYQNNYTLAQATLRWAPRHPRGLVRAATGLIEQDRWPDAEPYLVAVLQDDSSPDPLRKTAYEMLGLHYLSERRWDRFSTIARNASAEFPNNPTFRGLKAMLLIRQGQSNRGVSMLVEAAQNRQSAADINFLAANELRRAGNTDEAIALLEEGVRKDPSQPRIKLALAYLLRERQPERSLKLVQQVLQAAPGTPGAETLAHSLTTVR